MSNLFFSKFLRPISSPARFFSVLLITLSFNSVPAQSYLGLDGGFEGSATIDNATTYSTAQSGKWTKANSSQTIGLETSVVRSGVNSLSINNTDDTGARVWSPLNTVSTQTTEVTIQYYRYVTDAINSQANQECVLRDADESKQGTYNTPPVGTWEKQTYNPASSTFSSIAGFLMHRQIGTGGNMYIDDMCVYASGVDETAPSVCTAFTVGTVTYNSISLDWTAPVTGIDNGGYLVVRGTSDPNTAPNVNGIYAVGNVIGTGTVVYQGTGTGFTDSGLTDGTTYYYRIYTYDKAYNYSAALLGSQATASIPATTATAATSVTSTSFLANWDAGSGATGSKLDVSLYSVFGTTSNATLTEGFNNGISAPANWTFTNIGGTYTTSVSSGLTSPSLQMDNTNDRIQTPLFSGDATELSFWIKGLSTVASSSLLIEGYNGSSWVTIHNITNSLPTSGTTYNYNSTSTPQLPSGVKQFRFTYTKSGGNLAFDDLSVLYDLVTPSFLSFFEDIPVTGTSRTVTGLSPNTTYYYRVRATSPNSTSANSNVISVTTLAVYNVDASSNDGAKGSVSGGGAKDAGTSVSLTATPASASYRFVNWTENGNFVSKANPYTFTVSASKTLVANFTDATAPIAIAATTNASTFADCATCDVTVSTGAELAIDESKTFNSVTSAPGAKLTLTVGSVLTAPITLQSTADGTATFVDRNTGTPQTVSATVQQFLGAVRNWYISSPVSTATSPTTNITRYYEYIEPGNNGDLTITGATAYWKGYNVGHTMTVGKGYIAQANASTTINFNGNLNNNLEYPITVSRTGSASRAGFNLIGNPYMGYLDWKKIIDDPENSGIIETSKWYRTYNTSNEYTFATHNGTSGQTVTGTAKTDITKFIPPMQAFWVRVKSNLSGEQTIKLKKSMLEHRDVPGNKFKAPVNDNQSLLRLQVSNGSNTDEALVYFNPKASNTYDDFDSYKMFNNLNSLPEIYTIANGEKLVINGLHSMLDVNELPVGFATLQANNFSITATEIKNFDSSIQILLKDKFANTEFDLTNGNAYEFNSAAVNDANRFSILFRTSDSNTGLQTSELDSQTSVFVNANGNLVINTPAPIKVDAHVSVFNAIGQQISVQPIRSTSIITKITSTSGVYWVRVSNGDDVITRKVILNKAK